MNHDDKCSVPRCSKPKAAAYVWPGSHEYRFCAVHEELLCGMSGSTEENAKRMCGELAPLPHQGQQSLLDREIEKVDMPQA